MSQQQLPESRSDADISPESQNDGGESPSRPEIPPSSQLYLVAGPHSQLRTRLAWVNRLLAYDETLSVSVISLRDLNRALSAFQLEVRVQALGQGPDTAASSPSRSSTPTAPRSRNSIRSRTRNFKS